MKRSPFVTGTGDAPETRSPSKSGVEWLAVDPFVDTTCEEWVEEVGPDDKMSSRELSLACTGAVFEAGEGTERAGDGDKVALVLPSESKSNNTSAPPAEF